MRNNAALQTHVQHTRNYIVNPNDVAWFDRYWLGLIVNLVWTLPDLVAPCSSRCTPALDGCLWHVENSVLIGMLQFRYLKSAQQEVMYCGVPDHRGLGVWPWFFLSYICVHIVCAHIHIDQSSHFPVVGACSASVYTSSDQKESRKFDRKTHQARVT
jgi:hypothetical protein